MRGHISLLLLLVPTLAACPVKRDHGLGPCTEYRPVCLSSTLRCDTGRDGCEVCTCGDEGPPQPAGPPLQR